MKDFARFSSILVAAMLLSQAAAASWHPHRRGVASDNAVAYQLNVAHTGSITMSTGFSTPLKLLWSHVFNTDYSGPNYPLIADGMVFVSAVMSDTTTSVFAFDQDSGSAVWSKDFHTTVPPLAYDNATLFVGEINGHVSAFDSVSGAQKWSEQLPDDQLADNYPIAVNGIYYAGGGDELTEAYNVYAVHELDGSLAWGMTGFPLENGSPAYGPKGLYVAYPCEYFALNPKKPKVLWQDYEFCSGGGYVVPVYSDKRVYIFDQDRSNAVLDSKSGKEVDTFSGNDMPTLYDDFRGHSYGANLSQGTLITWKLSTGATAWSFAGDHHLSTQPIGVNGHVVIGSSLGMLYVLDGKSGKLEWSTNTGLVLENLVAGQGVLVASGGNTVKVYAPQ